MGNCFKERHSENIVRDVAKNNRLLKVEEVVSYRKMISRYFDVTARNCCSLLVVYLLKEYIGVSIGWDFFKLIDKSMIDHQIKIIDTDNSFYQLPWYI